MFVSLGDPVLQREKQNGPTPCSSRNQLRLRSLPTRTLASDQFSCQILIPNTMSLGMSQEAKPPGRLRNISALISKSQSPTNLEICSPSSSRVTTDMVLCNINNVKDHGLFIYGDLKRIALRIWGRPSTVLLVHLPCVDKKSGHAGLFSH